MEETCPPSNHLAPPVRPSSEVITDLGAYIDELEGLVNQHLPPAHSGRQSLAHGRIYDLFSEMRDAHALLSHRLL